MTNAGTGKISVNCEYKGRKNCKLTFWVMIPSRSAKPRLNGVTFAARTALSALYSFIFKASISSSFAFNAALCASSFSSSSSSLFLRASFLATIVAFKQITLPNYVISEQDTKSPQNLSNDIKGLCLPKMKPLLQ
ncbi:hypothetical protein M758_2G224600 [Ceratodon purpureus]|nr:hypothetical protein M758_2G224600 [Ceratodon purpureus]